MTTTTTTTALDWRDYDDREDHQHRLAAELAAEASVLTDAW
jgi:hypothetical protein